MKLVVGNLPSAATEAEVRAAFEKFGPCEVDLKGAQASVTFPDAAHAEEARTHLHHTSFSDFQITVEAAQESPRRERSRSRSRSPPQAPAVESPRKESVPHSPAKPPAEPVPAMTDSSEQGQSPAKPPAEPVPLVTDSSEQGQSPAKQEGLASVPAPEEEEPAKAEEAKGEPGEEVCAEDGSRFKIETVNKKNEELSKWKCLACNRTLQKKSVEAHIATKTHKQHLTS